MKKNIKFGAIFIIAITLTFCACSDRYSIPPESAFATSSNSNSILIVTEKTEYTSSDKYLEYTIVNNSDTDFPIENEDYVMQRYENGSWQEYPFKKDRIITLEAYEDMVVKKGGGTCEFGLTFKLDFDTPMEEGYYRFIRFGIVSNIFFIS